MPDLTVKHGCKNQTEFTQHAVKKQRKSAKSALGFSLLELLVVISLLGIVAMAATTLIIDSGEEKRKDATEKQWDAIRKAIVGDSTLSLNGSPNLSGYVADMGRLPSNIKELISQGVQPNWAEINIDPSGTAVGLSGTLHAGWRGPYLYTAGSAEFRDGWRNEDANAAEDAVNFGWNVILADDTGTQVFTGVSATSIAVQSLADGNQVGGAEYGVDFPQAGVNAVNDDDWQANYANIVFDLKFTSISGTQPNTPLELAIYYIDDAAIDTESVQFNYSGATGVSVTGTHTQQVVLATGGVGLPMGRYAAAVICPVGVSVTTTQIYDGDCIDAIQGPKNPHYFILLPTTQQVTIPWNTP